MTRAGCAAISPQELLGYWLGEFDAEHEARLDEHLLACAPCAERLGALVETGAAIRRALLRGGFSSVLSPACIDRLKTTGLRVREYRLEPGGSVNCTVTREDDLVVSYLRAPLRGVEQLDLVMQDATAGSWRLTDVAFDPAADCVAVVPDIAHLRALGRTRHRMQLVAVEAAGERVIADYTFDHTPE